MKSIIQHLRFPFSVLLMPVFLFSILFIEYHQINSYHIGLLFFILHVLVYPSSNAYNSTQDRDEGSVGMIEKPLPVTSNLLLITIMLDVSAIMLSLLINTKTAILLSIYILASRLYSWRKLRLKQYPKLGFYTVFLCQGALIFYMVQYAQFGMLDFKKIIFSIPFAFISSLFIGSMYPLSQIYQHEQDKKDGVETISALLGYKNTFLFAGAQFIAASFLLSYSFYTEEKLNSLIIYNVFQLPVIFFFLYWFYKVMKDNSQANFKHAMQMNIISALCMNLCFMLLIWNKMY